MLTQKLLKFTEKLKTASDKIRINMVTWSFLPFAVNVILNLSKKLTKFYCYNYSFLLYGIFRFFSFIFLISLIWKLYF